MEIRRPARTGRPFPKQSSYDRRRPPSTPADGFGAFAAFAVALLVVSWVAAAGCKSQGPFAARATVEAPGLSAREVDEAIARPVGAKLYQASAGVREVRAVSTAGRAQVYVTSDPGVKREEFVQSMAGAMGEAAAALPGRAAAGPITLLAPGETIPDEPAHAVGQIRIDFDRAKLIDAGLTTDDVLRAIGKAREREAEAAAEAADTVPTTLPAGAPGAPTAPSARGRLDALAATTLPSRAGPLTLRDVATLRLVTEPDRFVRHWP